MLHVSAIENFYNCNERYTNVTIIIIIIIYFEKSQNVFKNISLEITVAAAEKTKQIKQIEIN